MISVSTTTSSITTLLAKQETKITIRFCHFCGSNSHIADEHECLNCKQKGHTEEDDKLHPLKCEYCIKKQSTGVKLDWISRCHTTEGHICKTCHKPGHADIYPIVIVAINVVMNEINIVHFVITRS